MRAWRRWLVAALVIAGGLAGCTSDLPSDSSHRDLPATGPGTQLFEGYVVPRGAALVGRVFTIEHQQRTERVAVLQITGAPRQVWARMVRQRTDRRLQDQGCTPPTEAAVGGRRSEALECEAFSTISSTPRATVVLKLATRSADGHRPMATSLVLRSDRDHEAASWGRPIPPVDPARPTKRSLAPLLAPESFHVVRGSSPVGEPGPSLSVTGGFHAVLLVTGDPDAVVAGYLHQLTSRSFGYEDGTSGAVAGTVRGDRIIQGTVSAAGGGDAAVVAVVPRDGGPTYLLMTRAND